MKISLIVAAADNGVIGQTGSLLPWRLPADLAHFKHVTMGHPIIMGRKTYDTIRRPLPGRLNIVISRNPTTVCEGCAMAGSLDEALKIAAESEAPEAFVIGGGQIFREAMPLADKLYLTEVHAEPAGDVYFEYDADQWQEIAREDRPADDKNQYPYAFVTLTRKDRP